MLFDAAVTLNRSHVVVCVATDPDLLSTIRRLCSGLPCRTVVCERAEDALEMVGSTGVSLVVADERLGTMSGSRLLREVSRRSPLTARLLLASETGVRDPHLEEERPHGVIPNTWNSDSLRRSALAILKWQEERRSMTEPLA